MNLSLGTAFEGTFWSLSYVRFAVLYFIKYVINDHSLQTVISLTPLPPNPAQALDKHLETSNSLALRRKTQSMTCT